VNTGQYKEHSHDFSTLTKRNDLMLQ